MWSGFDPELRRQFESMRQMVKLSHQAPTREWPVVFVNEQNALLVVREWPDGTLTAYLAKNNPDKPRNP
jgi:hypothetical protein